MGLVSNRFCGNTVLAQRDIDNAYWDLPKQGVLDAIREAARFVRKHRRMYGGFFFSKARGGERLLDRIGKAADRGLRVVPWEHVMRFVEWDVDHNTLFEYNGWVINQHIKGVPIGGFLCAQLMCLWARVHEITFLNDPRGCLTRSAGGGMYRSTRLFPCVQGLHSQGLFDEISR